MVELALYHPEHGFYSSGGRAGRRGDFITSPEVGPLFGALVAEAIDREWDRCDRPARFTLVDGGAGPGTLARGVLAAAPRCLHALEYVAVERSELQRDQHPESVASASDFPAGPLTGVVIANELLDNLPMAVAVRRGSGWSEHWVEEEGGDLAIVERPARPEVGSWADLFGGKVAESGLVEVQLQAGKWLGEAVASVGKGTIVVIDYGGTAEELEHRRVEGTLRTYRSHHLGPDPLLEPGKTDITADVNFSALLAIASKGGAVVELHRQDDFLTDLGLRSEVSALRKQELELARQGDEMARLKVRSRRTEAETLLNPRGLGDFRVLVARIER